MDGRGGEAGMREQALRALGRGANQIGARAHNERLALSLIRRNGPLAKAELARLTGLSAQTLTQMMRRLEADGLVVAQAPMRGRIGQPSVPFALNPEGALSIGVKLGRRSADVVLCDFVGSIRARAGLAYPWPEPRKVLSFVARAVAAMRRPRPQARLVGAGVAMPSEIWKWAGEVEAPRHALDGWRDLDVAAEIGARLSLPTALANDATAACGAELARTAATSTDLDFLYVFVGSFVGGGVALNGALYPGRSGNAGALGSMPVAGAGGAAPLIRRASLLSLERMLPDGEARALLQRPDEDWSRLGAPLDAWIADAAKALAQAAVAACSVIDFPCVRIDGALPRPTLKALVGGVRREAGLLDCAGLSPFEIVEGAVGADARALGAAMLPILAAYGAEGDAPLAARAERDPP